MGCPAPAARVAPTQPPIPGPARNLPPIPVQNHRAHLSAGPQAGGPPPAHLPPPGRGDKRRTARRESLLATTLYNHPHAKRPSCYLSHGPHRHRRRRLLIPTRNFLLVFLPSSPLALLPSSPPDPLENRAPPEQEFPFSSMEIDAENLSATELRLGLPGTSSRDDKKPSPIAVGSKRALDDTKSEASGTGPGAGDDHQDAATPAKAQVVGWPPVRAYRKNTFQAAAAAAKKAEQRQQQQAGGLYVKVSMDGAPYLRKVDLRMYTGYRELRDALDALFTKSFSAAAEGGGGGGEHQSAVAYEDKDGDLMLVGDVPWDMFISSCKKLRIMKGSEAR